MNRGGHKTSAADLVQQLIEALATNAGAAFTPEAIAAAARLRNSDLTFRSLRAAVRRSGASVTDWYAAVQERRNGKVGSAVSGRSDEADSDPRAPLVTVLETKHVRGLEPPRHLEQLQQHRTVPINGALSAEYDTDAHVALYSVMGRARIPRINKAGLNQAREELGEVVFTCIFVDVDCPEADLPNIDFWWDGQLDRIQCIPWRPGWYRTRGGYRLVWALPVPLGPEEYEEYHTAWTAELREQYDIEADPACRDWTRLYRLPFVVRDGEKQEFPADFELTELLFEPPPTDRAFEGPPTRAVGEKGLVGLFREAGFYLRAGDGDKHVVACPWEEEHTKGKRGDTSTVLLPTPGGGHYFHCSHRHCAGRHNAAIRVKLPDLSARHCPSRSNDLEKMIEAIPQDCTPRDVEAHLKQVFKHIVQRDASVQGLYLPLLKQRTGLGIGDLREGLKHAARIARSDADHHSEVIFEGEIQQADRFYFTRLPDGRIKALSSFVIQPRKRVETENGEIIIGRALTDKATERELRLPLDAFRSKRELLQHLPSADLQWTGSDNNVQGLLRVLAQFEVPRCRGTTMVGNYQDDEHHLWIYPGGAFGKDGFVDPPPVVFVDGGGSLAKRVRYVDADEKAFIEVARKVFEYLPFLNTPKVILPIIGWFFASPFKPSLMKSVGSFPILFIHGTPGSGKSTVVTEVLWPMSGLVDSLAYSATQTEFALLKLLGSSRSVPVFIDEYKPVDMPRRKLNTLHRCIRRLYRGEVEERGRRDQKVNTYHLQVPLCVAGEALPMEAALLERIVTSVPDKVTLKEHPEYREALGQLRAVDLSLFAPRYIQFCLSRDVAADLDAAAQVVDEMLSARTVPLRVVKNLTAMVLGIQSFQRFAEACGYRELPADLGIKEAVDAVLDDVLETAYGVKNPLDQFLEMLGVMAVQGEVRHRKHYVFSNDLLFVHVATSYDSFRQHCKRIDYQGEVVPLKALRRLIRENQLQNGYVVSQGERAQFDGGRRRAMGIDLSKTELVSKEDFPEKAREPERGATGQRRGTPPSLRRPRNPPPAFSHSDVGFSD